MAQRQASRTPRHRWRRRALVGLGIALVVFVAASLALFVWPPTDQPRHVDAILSLNGPNEGARQALAVSLAEKGYASTLIFSRGGYARDTPCPKVPRISVVCFVDVPNDTRGEARWAGRYAERHHLHSLMIVPGRPQVTRARLLMERCFSGQIVVVPASEPLLRFPLDVFHEWFGLAEALLIDRSC
jgi:hypothetical protein